MSFVNSHNYWLEASLLPEKCETRSTHKWLFPSLWILCCSTRDCKVNSKNKYPSVCPPWTWTPLNFCSLRCCSFGIPGWRGQTEGTDRQRQITGSERILVSENNHVFSGPEVKVPMPLCKCLSAVGYHSNHNRVLQWAALYKGSENQLLNISALDTYRSITVYRPGFGIFQKEKWSSEWLLAQPRLFIHICPPLCTVNTACRTPNSLLRNI